MAPHEDQTKRSEETAREAGADEISEVIGGVLGKIVPPAGLPKSKPRGSSNGRTRLG